MFHNNEPTASSECVIKTNDVGEEGGFQGIIRLVCFAFTPCNTIETAIKEGSVQQHVQYVAQWGADTGFSEDGLNAIGFILYHSKLCPTHN